MRPRHEARLDINCRYKLAEEAAIEDFEDGSLLFLSRQRRMIEINKSARRILSLMNGDRTLKMIIKAVTRYSRINEERAKRDVYGLIGSLRRLKAIGPVLESRPNHRNGIHNQTLVTANPAVLLRERKNGGAELFFPDTGARISVNPVGVLIWKIIKLRTIAISDVTSYLKKACMDAPRKNVGADVVEFIADLQRKGMIGINAYE